MNMATNKPLIITASEMLIDIDILSCALAYRKLLSLRGITTKVVLPGSLTSSVTDIVRGWNFTYETALEGSPEDFSYVLVDISEPDQFAKFVVLDNIIELYDHRHGFENFWKERLGDKAKIELIGACATLIWEEYKKAGLENKIDTLNANLLYTAILSNTLNLQAQITSPRDKNALDELSGHIDLPDNWRQIYFDEVSKEILSYPVVSMENDTKKVDINNTKYIIIQLELWNSHKFIEDNYGTIIKVLNKHKNNFTFLTSPSISEGFNYIVATNDTVKNKLQSCIGVDWDVDIGKTKKLWLRKEIIRLL